MRERDSQLYERPVHVKDRAPIWVIDDQERAPVGIVEDETRDGREGRKRAGGVRVQAERAVLRGMALGECWEVREEDRERVERRGRRGRGRGRGSGEVGAVWVGPGRGWSGWGVVVEVEIEVERVHDEVLGGLLGAADGGALEKAVVLGWRSEQGGQKERAVGREVKWEEVPKQAFAFMQLRISHTDGCFATRCAIALQVMLFAASWTIRFSGRPKPARKHAARQGSSSSRKNSRNL